jgi:hypothetical protein
MASNEMMAAYLAGELDPAAREELERELLADVEARTELLGQRRISAALHALLGDSASLERAIVSTLQSAPEELAVARIVEATVVEARRTAPDVSDRKIIVHPAWNVRKIGRVAWKIAAVVALVFSVGAVSNSFFRKALPVAALRDAAGAEWSAVRPDSATGDLRQGVFELKNGIAELEFHSGARVVVESPAKLKLLHANGMELTSGRISAYVPEAATGFTVRTSAGDIVDIGTRFGVDATVPKRAEVHVLEGVVQVHPMTGKDQALHEGEAVSLQRVAGMEIVPSTFAPERFPRGARVLPGKLIGGGFEENNLVVIDYAPREFGIWSGDPALVVPAIDGVSPRSGEKMLRFDIPQRGKPAASQQWQVVDARPLREAAKGAKVEVVFRAWFNRAATAHLNPNFTVTVASFKGDPAQAPHFWADRQGKALTISEAYIHTDLHPETWEKAETRIPVPPDADFLLVRMAANEPHGTELGGSGHYADDAELEIHVASRRAVTPVARR